MTDVVYPLDKSPRDAASENPDSDLSGIPSDPETVKAKDT